MEKPEPALETAPSRGPRGPLPPPLSALSRWLKDHQRLVLALLVAASLLVRAGYFLELSRGPCRWQHLWDQSDMNFFDTWARDIAGGDWLTNKSLHPLHDWHRFHAQEYFRLHPEAAAALAGATLADGTPADATRVLWDRWLGGKTFQQEPLYPYLVALTYKVFGADVRWVFLWQLLLGVAIVVLVYLLARRYFGELVAAVAGFLAVMCGPLLYYDLLLLRSTLITFMGLTLVYLSDLALARGTWRWWLVLGLVGGLAVSLMSTFILFIAGLVLILAVSRLKTPRSLWPPLVALLAGMVISLSPVVARNLAVGVSPLNLSSVGTQTFISANTEDFPPESGFYFTGKHFAKIMGDTDGRFFPAVVETLETYPSWWSYPYKLWQKFALIWHWYEIPNNDNFYYYRLHAAILRYLPITFLVLAPLSLLGLALAAAKRTACGPLYLWVLTNLAIMVVFYVLSRFRVSLLAALLPFAALALVQTSEWLLARRWALSAGAVAVLVALSFWTMRPLPWDQPLIRPEDYMVDFLLYDPLGRRAAAQNDWPQVAAVLERSLQFEPQAVQEMGKSRLPRGEGEIKLARWYAVVHSQYAQALDKMGREREFQEQEQRALELFRAADGKMMK